MEYSCCFCSKTEEETPLIELSSNLLFIGKSHFDFSHVFFELFKINVRQVPFDVLFTYFY